MDRIPLAEKMRPNSLKEVVGQSHLIGDGKIFVYNLENAVRIRTGEEGPSAIMDPQDS